MAASICSAMRCEAACTYWLTSTRDTMPLVIDALSPPVGYPSTRTLACSAGTSPKRMGSMGEGDAQNSSSVTASRAKSHS